MINDESSSNRYGRIHPIWLVPSHQVYSWVLPFLKRRLFNVLRGDDFLLPSHAMAREIQNKKTGHSGSNVASGSTDLK
jgi:hypothetical protein